MPEINDQYIIQKETINNIADGVRWRTGLNNAMTPAQMVAELKKKYGTNRQQTVDYNPDTGAWVRPSGWPDLDSLNLEMAGDDFIYMTYDANKEASAISWHIETANRQPATLDIGHIENGVYVADESYSVAHNTSFAKWTDEYNGYLVLRITGQIARCYSVSTSRNGQWQRFKQQPILERIAWVPHLTAFCANYNSNIWGTCTLEREKIANGNGTTLTSMYYAWAYCKRLRDLDISGFHTPNVTTMNATFYQCQFLKTLDLRHWDVQKVTNFGAVFSTCYGLTNLDLRGWDTGKGTTFASMFADCRSLPFIKGLGEFDVSKATSFSSMFNGCYNLQDFSGNEWDTRNCTNFSSMFAACYMLEELDLSKWDVQKVTNVGSMFNSCQNLRRVCFDGWQTGVLTGVSQIFTSCHNLENIDVSWMHITSACTSIYNMFNGCWLLKELDVPDDWDLSGLGSGNNTANSFCLNCYSLERITGIRDWQFSFSGSLGSMFSGCYSLRELDVSGWKTNTVISFASMFLYCYSLEQLDLSGWESDNCTNFSSMFSGCWSLKRTGDISGWDTSKVTTFASMFTDCLSLPEFPDISDWNFGAATSVASMFAGLSSVKEISIINLSLPNCTSIATMFQYCRALEKATLTGWSIPKVTSTAPGAFLGNCINLRDLVIDIPIALNHSYINDESLSHESLINILNSLPSVSASRTLNLVTANIDRLTAEEKAIATSKGWTLAN